MKKPVDLCFTGLAPSDPAAKRRTEEVVRMRRGQMKQHAQ